MTADLNPYPEYKGSGLPWFGQVPAHWEVRRIKTLLREVDRRSKTGEETLLSMTRKRGLIRHAEATDKLHAASTLVGYKICRPGEVVMNRMQAWSGMFHVAPEQGLVSPDYAVFTPLKSVNPRFLGHLLRSPMMVAKFYAESKGIGSGFLRLYGDRFGAIHVAVPSCEEQDAAVRFIDILDRKVRRFIRNRQRLIGVLNEQKQAIINRAVTRGLDPNVPLKPSGIEWLGDIPQQWRVQKLRWLFRRHGSGTTPSGEHYYGGDVAWVMTGDLTDAEIRTTKRTVTKQALADISVLRLYSPGSLLVAMYGATIGKTGVLMVDACTNQACCVLAEPVTDVNALYLQAAIRIARPHLIQQGYGGGQPNINAEVVRSLRVPVPSRDEQDAIVRCIGADCSSLDTAIDRAQREIDLIREYRTRLSADVVTGKVDVRHLAPPPEAIAAEAELEDLDEGLDEEMLREDEAELVLEETDADD